MERSKNPLQPGNQIHPIPAIPPARKEHAELLSKQYRPISTTFYPINLSKASQQIEIH
jgi:hypothetical protein